MTPIAEEIEEIGAAADYEINEDMRILQDKYNNIEELIPQSKPKTARNYQESDDEILLKELQAKINKSDETIAFLKSNAENVGTEVQEKYRVTGNMTEPISTSKILEQKIPEPKIPEPKTSIAPTMSKPKTTPSSSNDALSALITAAQNKIRFAVEISSQCKKKEQNTSNEEKSSIDGLIGRRTRTTSECKHDLPKQEEEMGTFFKIWSKEDIVLDSGEERLRLDVEVDSRMSIAQFKLRVEPFTCMKMREFQVFKKWASSCDTGTNADGVEVTADSYNPFASVDGSIFVIKQGKALRSNESKVKFYRLNINDLTKVSTGWFYKNVIFKGLKLPSPRQYLVILGHFRENFDFPESVPKLPSFGKGIRFCKYIDSVRRRKRGHQSNLEIAVKLLNLLILSFEIVSLWSFWQKKRNF